MSVPGAAPSSSLVNCNLDQAGRGWAIGLYAMLSADEAANADGTEALHRRLDRPGGIGQSASLRPAGETRLSPMPFGKFRPVAPRCRMASVEDRTPWGVASTEVTTTSRKQLGPRLMDEEGS